MNIGAHLWSFEKNSWETELPTLLPALRDAGYAGFEAFLRVPATASQLEALQMPLLAAHTKPPEMADFEAFSARLELLGTRDVCSSGLWHWNQRSPDDYLRAAQFLNRTGRRLRERGIHLHYHNHEWEFERDQNGRCGMDLLLENLDPDAATLCLDLGWMHVAGEDVLPWITKHAARIGYIHLRDFKDKKSVALGQGDVSICAQLEAVKRLPGVRHIVVEQDPDTSAPLDDMLASRAFLRQNCGA